MSTEVFQDDAKDTLNSFIVERMNGGGIVVTQNRSADAARGAPIRRAFSRADDPTLETFIGCLIEEMPHFQGEQCI